MTQEKFIVTLLKFAQEQQDIYRMAVAPILRTTIFSYRSFIQQRSTIPSQ